MVSIKRKKAAKKAWRTRRKRYGANGIKGRSRRRR